MLYWAILFLVISITAGILGFGGISEAAAGISKVLFILTLIVFVVLLAMGLTGASLVT